MSNSGSTNSVNPQTFWQRSQALVEIGFALNRAASLDDLYRDAVLLGCSRLGFDRLGLFLYDRDTNTMIGTYGVDAQGRLSDERDFRQVVDDPERLRILQDKLHYKVWQNATLFVKGEPVGRGWNALGVLWDGDQGLGWLSADNLLNQKPLEEAGLELLVIYSAYLGQILAGKQKELALEQARRQTEAKAEALSLVNRIADTLYRSYDVQMVLQQACQFITAYTAADALAILTLNRTSEMLRVVASQGLTQESLAAGAELPLQGSLSGIAVTEQRIVVSTDMKHDNRLFARVQQWLLAQGLKTTVSLPILFHDKAWGVINLFFKTPYALGQQEQETLLTIGRTIGVALNNAEIVSQIQQEIRAKELLERQNQEALEIRSYQIEIAKAISAAQTEEEVIQTIIKKTSLFPQAGAGFFTCNPENPHIYTLIARNPNQSNLQLLPVGAQLNAQEMSELFWQTEPIIIANVTDATFLGKRARRMAQQVGIASWAIFPIIAAGERLGLLMVASQKPDFFQESHRIIYQTIAEQGATAMRAARLFHATQESLKRRSEEVAVATQIAQEIASATSLNDLYRRVVTQIHELFGYYHTQLLRYDQALDTMILVYGYGEVGQKMLDLNHSIPMNVGIIGTAAATGKPILRPNLLAHHGWQPNPLLPHTKGELAIPIKLREELLAVLDVQSDKADRLDENDLILLEGLCGQIAVAIESTRLRDEMSANLRELTSLQRQMSREAWLAYKQSRANIGGYLFDRADITPLDIHANFLKASNGHRPNFVTTPLQVRGEPFGTIGVLSDSDRPLAAEELDLLHSISEQVSEALEAARLFEQTQDALLEQERLASELETVAQVTTAASTILEVDQLLQVVVDLTKSSFDLYHVHIYLADESGQNLALKAGAGNVGRLMTLEGWNLPLTADSIVARAAREREVVIENDVQKVIDFLPHPLLPKTRAEMAIPMIVGNQLIGILDLQAEQPGRFTEEDIKIQRTLGTQVAVAVQNARLYAEQVKTSEKLRQVDQLKSEFLASMSHELRTPLNSIIGFADVLLEGLDGELNDRMEQDVRLIRNSGEHLRNLIGDILDMSKIEAGRMELRYEMVDMRDLVNDIVANAMSLAQEKHLDLITEIDPEVSMVEADRTRMRQILWNITGNAIKFTEKGSVTISMQVDRHHLLVGVHDTGIGISPEDIPIVFEQFRQIDGSLNRRAGGTGLGMPITKNLVELHGGKIWVESVLGMGTTFWFTIPLTQDVRDLPETGPLVERSY